MKKLVLVLMAIALGGGLLGCQGQQAEPESEIPAAVEPEVEMSTGPVEVAEEGTTFDPPVMPDQLPDGVWYCPMETVHYASGAEGNGTCPICGMSLTRKVAPEPEPEPEA